jgi:hypothetical protein
MQASQAAKLAESRGYRDVNPANGWADWHRVRVEMTGKGFLPRIVLCLPGAAGYAERCERVLAEAGIEHEWHARDERMLDAFEASEFPLQPSLQDADRKLIENHESVLYVLSAHFTAGQALVVSRDMVRLGRRLLEAGGCAIKCESSGIAHSRTRWTELAQRMEKAADEATRWSALISAFLQYPLQSETDLCSCGMHLLGAPDLITGVNVMVPEDAAELFSAFSRYLLAECPPGGFVSRSTFSSSADAPQYRVVWEPCTGYAENDFFFNPFGLWRFTP